MAISLIIGGAVIVAILFAFREAGGGTLLNIGDRLTKNAQERGLDAAERKIAISRDTRGVFGNIAAFFVGEKAYLEAETGNPLNPTPTNPGVTPADKPRVAEPNPAQAFIDFKARRGSYRGRNY